MFAYEFYKRNVAVLGIGGIEAERERLENIGPDVYTTKFDGELPSRIEGFFEKAPSFNFLQGYTNERSAMVEAVLQVKNAAQSLGAAYNALEGDGALAKITNLFNQAGGAIKGDEDALISNLAKSLSAETNTNKAPGMSRWTGQEAIEFSVKFIFLDEKGGPVFFDKRMKTLLSLVTYNGTDGTKEKPSYTMRGPIGFHGTATGIGQLNLFLDQEFNRLHSLTLYKGTGSGKQKILDLHRILVIKSINFQTSEQLYLSSPKEGPAYKWITADIGFVTACPIPNAFSGHKTNISNFYGITERTKRTGISGNSTPS